jgi:hypothetical protein
LVKQLWRECIATSRCVDELIRCGVVADYADLARLGQVSRARVTQIMNLLNLAPDIQEEILFLPRAVGGRTPITDRDVRPLTAFSDWSHQRKYWCELVGTKDNMQH